MLIFKFIYLEKFKNSVSTSSQPPSQPSNEDYYSQGGFCKYQEKLGNYVGCSEHIYDKSYFNLDRELDSVKPEYTILSS